MHLNENDYQQLNLDRYVFLFETMDDNLEFLVYDKTLKGYIRYHIDEKRPYSDYDLLTWDGTFVAQILTWYEDDHSDQEILEICDLLGLKYGNEILESIKAELGTRYTTEQTNNWINRTIEKINGRLSNTHKI